MILISKFSDMYDFIIHQRGRDNKIVFRRDYECDPFARDPIASEKTGSFYYQLQNNRLFNAIVIAGVVHPFINQTKYHITPTKNEFSNTVYHPAEIDGVNIGTGEKSKSFRRWWGSYRKGDIGTKVESKYVQELYDYQVKNNLPVITVEIYAGSTETRYYLKPQLLLKQVPVRIDNTEVVNSIYNMLSSMLDVNPPVEVDDKMKLHKHGFDGWSFKKR